MERKYPNLCKRAGFEMLMVHGGHKKRRTGLNSEDIEHIKSIDSDEIHIMFGKMFS